MKSLKMVLPFVLAMAIFTQCDTVSSDMPKNEQQVSTQLTTPANSSVDQSTDAQLEWNPIKGAQTYQLMVSNTESFDEAVIETTVTGTSYKAQSLSQNTTYFWKVFPVKSKNSGPWSQTWSFTTGGDSLATEATSVMTLISPENNADKVSSILKFTWNELQNTSEYIFQLSDNSAFSSVLQEKTVAGTSYIPEGLSYQKRYHWRVKGVGDGTEWSEVRTFTTGTQANDEEIPESVVTLIAPVQDANKVSTNLEFSWNGITGVNKYVYQLSDNSTFSSVLQEKTVTGTSYKPAGLVKQKRYHWRVRAAGDATEWSEVRTFTTGTSEAEEAAPQEDEETAPEEEEVITIVTLNSPVNNADKVSINLEFSWNAVTGATQYVYQLSDNSTFSSVLHEKTVTGTSYTPAALSKQKRYHWRVKAAGNDTEWSETFTFTTGTEGDTNDTGDSGDTGDTGDNGDTSTVTTLLTPQNNSIDISTGVEFAWNELSGITHYQFQLSDNSTFSSLVDETIAAGTTYSSDVLTFDKKYFWRVKADVAGSEWSEVFSFNTEVDTYVPPTPTPSSGSFVGVQNANFVRDGQVMRFSGTNAYYLPNYEKLNSGVVDRALNLFQDTGITVVRMWGFYDGYDCGYSKNDSSENVIQTSPGVYSEEALRDLDNVIAKGKDRGISFIIPFINFWDELGGVCQYNTWAGASNPSTNMDFFLSNSQTQKWFKDYISMLLNRVNTVTGIAYKDEPAIFGWQIMNEGRNRGQNFGVLRDWYQEIARHIKSIDNNHIVSTGEEGFDEGTPGQYSVDQYSNTYALRANEGTSYVANTAIPEIDFGSAHWYPGEYGFGHTVNSDFLQAQRAWLSDHKNIAESVGKPFYIGEFGFNGYADSRVIDMYNALYQHSEEIKLDGNLLWQLVADGTKCWEFGGNICYPGGRADTDLYNKFKQHITNMKGMK